MRASDPAGQRDPRDGSGLMRGRRGREFGYRDDERAQSEAEQTIGGGAHQPTSKGSEGTDAGADGMGEGVDGVGYGVPAIVLQPVQDDAAADPEHRGGTNQAQEREEARHGAHDAAANGTQG